MDRTKQIINRIEEELIRENFKKKIITQQSEFGYGDLNSFFELMVDLRLEGKITVSSEEVWENMKKQINYLKTTATKAA